MFHPLAKEELIDSKQWYAERSQNALQNFQVEILTVISIIKETPKIFQISFENKRKANLKKFPYSIVYSVHNDEVLILSVFHNSRNPEIWKEREWNE